MIRDTLSPKNSPALTCDHWHLVHARWNGVAVNEPRFERAIVSEHESREQAIAAARSLLTTLVPGMVERQPEQRDQVFVRRPGFTTLKRARRAPPRAG